MYSGYKNMESTTSLTIVDLLCTIVNSECSPYFSAEIHLSLSFLFLSGSDNRDDQFPRVCVVAFLSRLQPSNQLHERLMEELVLCLLKKVRPGLFLN